MKLPVRLFLAMLAVAFGVALGAAAPAHAQQGALTPEQREDIWRRMTPEQREQMWLQMTPEQRGNVIRRLTPEQREALRERMTPEQREQFRQRFLDRRERRMGEGGPHRLTPEERQRLREQIYESNRGLREQHRGPMGGGRRGPPEGRGK